MSVKIIRPSLDDLGGNTVLRGLVARESLEELRVDFYQREKMSNSSRREITHALESGAQLPDIDLGMRGDRFAMTDNNEVELLDPVFIIDGLQRVSTIKDYLVKHTDSGARLGATIHFNTNANWERERFHKLNTARSKVSPNVLLRNMKEDVPLLASLYGLSKTNQEFCLHNRVTWAQNPSVDDLVSGLTYLRTVLRVHAHLVPTRHVSTVDGVLASAMRLEKRIGIPMVRQNCMALWGLLDELWGIKEHKVKASIPYLRVTFLQCLTDIISDHVDFWAQPNETKLQVPYLIKRKLAKLPVYDPEIVRLSGASGKAAEALYFIIVTHLNSGKRTNRLIPRNARAHISSMADDEDNEEVA